METSKLSATNGHVIAGAKIDAHRFVGRVKAAQLFQIAPDPRDAEDKKKYDASKALQELQGIREEVQRNFEGAKRKNVPSYADYIAAVSEGEEGITPPITLYVEQELDVEEYDNGTALIQLPWEYKMVAIDGETQLAARHEAANISPDTKHEFVPVYICHGVDVGWARQAFHDLNALGVKPNAALSLGMDARDPMTRIARQVERQVDFFTGRVNKVRRQLRSTDPHVVTITALRTACVTFAKGINGVQFGTRPVPMGEQDIPQLEAAAIDWFAAVADSIGPAIEDRSTNLASTPAVLAAIGAVGYPLISMSDEAGRRAHASKLASALREVDWSRNVKWAGIAGKINPKGIVSVGGAKENAYAVYSALAVPGQPSFNLVRPNLQASSPSVT